MLPWWEKAKRQQPEVLSRICCGLNHWLCFLRPLPSCYRNFSFPFADICLALFATAMFNRLRVNWASSLLGFLALAFLPIPFLFYIYGERLRKHSSYAPTDFLQVPAGFYLRNPAPKNDCRNVFAAIADAATIR
jgi:hypothetical protein